MSTGQSTPASSLPKVNVSGDNFSQWNRAAPTSTLGIIHDTLLPSLQIHSGLSLLAYTAARVSGRAEVKDWLWPSGMVLNAWWSAIGRKVYQTDLSISDAFRQLGWSEKTLLFGVTAWGLRLFYRIATRSVSRGKDDPRYEEPKKQPGFWNKALFNLFLPEAVFQSLITLPVTAPFRYPSAGPASEFAGWIRGAAVGLFSPGFAMEILADRQAAKHKDSGARGLKTDGVWSIVRHPK